MVRVINTQRDQAQLNCLRDQGFIAALHARVIHSDSNMLAAAKWQMLLRAEVVGSGSAAWQVGWNAGLQVELREVAIYYIAQAATGATLLMPCLPVQQAAERVRRDLLMQITFPQADAGQAWC